MEEFEERIEAQTKLIAESLVDFDTNVVFFALIDMITVVVENELDKQNYLDMAQVLIELSDNFNPRSYN